MTEPTTAAKRTPAKKPSTNTPASGTSFAERAAMNTAPAWRPEKDDILHGEVVGTRVGTTSDYPDYPVLILEQTNGEYIAFHAFHGVAQDILSSLRPKRGEVLTIQYLGTQVTNATKDKDLKDQTAYHLYYIEREGDAEQGVSEEFSWDA